MTPLILYLTIIVIILLAISHLASGEGHITIFGHDYSAIGQGTWGFVTNVGWGYQSFYNSTTTDGDNISYKVYLDVGTYTLRLNARDDILGGIVDIDIDAAEVASFDLYDSTTKVNELYTQTGISIASAGLKTLRIRLDGKNGSSNDYRAILNVLALWRTA